MSRCLETLYNYNYANKNRPLISSETNLMDELANDHQIHVEAIFEFDNQWQTMSHQQKASCHNLPFGQDIVEPHGWPRVESPLLVVEYLHHYYRGYNRSKLVELRGLVIERHYCDLNNIGFGVDYF